MFDVTVMGEVLIDFTESGKSELGMRLFEQNPGGAPANVACVAARMGLRSAFLGKVGDDMHGVFLRETLEQVGVHTGGMITDPRYFTTLAFVSLSDDGERSFSFARKPGADTCITAEEIDLDVIGSTRIFHVGSLSMTDEPARSATLYAVEQARKAGAMISYDPNYRASLWDSTFIAQEQMRRLLPLCDLVKISDEETELLTGRKSPEDAAKAILEMGIPLVAVTLGKRGALVATGDGMEEVPTFPGPVVDTTAAGDSFWGGFLYCLLQTGKQPGAVTVKETAEFARFGNATATLCVGQRGAIGSIPAREQVETLLKNS